MGSLKEWLDGIVTIDANGFPKFIRIPTVDELHAIKPTDAEGMEVLFKLQSYLGLKSPDAMRQANVKYLERFNITPSNPLYQQKLEELNSQVNSNRVLTATSRRITEQAQTLTMLEGKDKHCIYVNEGDDPCDYCLYEGGTEGLYSYFVANDLLPGSQCAGGDSCLCVIIPHD